MNITPVEIYWLTRLDEFGVLLTIVVIILVLLAILNAAGGFIAMDSAHSNRCFSFGNKSEVANDEARMRMRFTRAIKLGVVAFLLELALSFVPSTKQMAAIIIIPKIANSEIVAEMGDTTKELIGLARDWMRTLAPTQDSQRGDTK